MLEAPYILTVGLPSVQGVSLSGRGTMFAATTAGTLDVQSDGQHHLLDARPARAVSAHAKTLYILDADGQTLRWGPLPAPGQPAQGLRTVSIEIAVSDMQAWCDEQVLLASAQGLLRWTPTKGTIVPFGPRVAAQRVSLAPDPVCESALVIDEDRVYQVFDSTRRPLGTAIAAPQSAAVQAGGRIWLAHGAPAVLSVLTPDGGWEVRARHLGDARDIVFGGGVRSGGASFSPGNIYIANGEGRLEYAQVAAP